mgnify:CR=1 FL=1
MNRFSSLAVLLIVALSGCHHQHQEAQEQGKFLVTSPLRKDTELTKDFVAQIRAIQHIEVRALEKGYLQGIYVDEGQHIDKGAKMFQIMPRVYQAEVQKAAAEAELTEIELKNTKLLADKNVVSPNELALAKRTGRDRATIAHHFFTKDDRRISLRFYLDLVRSAGASLRGAPETTPQAVIARLKELRHQQGLTVSTLALRADIHRSQLSTILNKTNPNPSLWTVKRLVAALCADTELDIFELQPLHVVNSSVGG